MTSYTMPLAALAMALAVRASGLSVDEGWLNARILVGALSSAIMFTTIFVVLDHAEAVARRVGEPYGTLVLTFAVTAIEVSIIVSMMLHGENNPTLARESVFSTVMITSTGVVGICLTLGGWRYRKQAIVRQGTSAYLSVLIALTVLTLVLPNFTVSEPGPVYAPTQLGFVATHQHPRLNATRFAQGDISLVVNNDDHGQAAQFRKDHGPSANGMAFRVADAQAAAQPSDQRVAEQRRIQVRV